MSLEVKEENDGPVIAMDWITRTTATSAGKTGTTEIIPIQFS
jgi:hypothetical protein